MTPWIWSALVLFVIALFALYKYMTRDFNYWKERNVPFLKPIPFFGNFYGMLSGKYNIGSWLQLLYQSSDKPFLGIFTFDTPALVVRSPELIKQILQKDFNVFDNRSSAEIAHEPITGQMIFFSKNPKWKILRKKSSPIFTSGKLRKMLDHMKEICENMVEHLNNNVTENSTDAKEVGIRLSLDVISKCAFGVDANCIKYADADFRNLARRMFEFNIRNAVNQLSIVFAPRFAQFFKATFFDKWVIDFAKESLQNVMKVREDTNDNRNDLVDILIEMKTHPEYNKLFDDVTLLSTALNFFGAGFETTASTISFCLYELALNTECQTKLRNEISAAIHDNDGKISYDLMKKVKYLEMCIYETLRKYPILPYLDRECNKDYTIPDRDIVLKKGTPIYIPLMGLHQDKKYFPEPLKFDPERFADFDQINKDGLHFLPFGDGPRVCIGERFAMLETKLALIHIVSQFELQRTEDTQVPLAYEPKAFFLQSKCGLPLRFVPIKSSNSYPYPSC